MKRSKLFALIFVGLMLAGCVSQGAPEVTVPSPTPVSTPLPTPAPTPVPEDPVQLLLDSLTLEEKVGQLFMVRPESLGVKDDPANVTQQLLPLNIESNEVGGAKKIAKELVSFIEGYDKLDAAKLLTYAK